MFMLVDCVDATQIQAQSAGGMSALKRPKVRQVKAGGLLLLLLLLESTLSSLQLAAARHEKRELGLQAPGGRWLHEARRGESGGPYWLAGKLQ